MRFCSSRLATFRDEIQMKIARYLFNKRENYGFLIGDSVVSLPVLAKQCRKRLPETVEGFIAGREKALQTAEKLLEVKDKKMMSLRDVELLAPLVQPPKIVCLGLNYRDHAKETAANLPKEPIIFMKPRTAIVGPNGKIRKSFVKELDYEGELAIVMGKKCKDVAASEAARCVFGFTILNDVSAREIQFGDRQWTRGKSFDTFAPMGPYIVTRSQLPDTSGLRIRTWVNGELRQDGSTKNMVFGVEEVVHQLSRVMTLEPCDVIATGTPAGVAMAMKEPKWLRSGDVVRIEIDGVGVLENTVE